MKNDRERGFIGAIVSMVAALIILQAVFKVDVMGVLKSPDFGEIVSYLKKFLILIWEKFLVLPVSFLWNEVFIDIIWDVIKDGFELLKKWVDTNQS